MSPHPGSWGDDRDLASIPQSWSPWVKAQLLRVPHTARPASGSRTTAHHPRPGASLLPNGCFFQKPGPGWGRGGSFLRALLPPSLPKAALGTKAHDRHFYSEFKTPFLGSGAAPSQGLGKGVRSPTRSPSHHSSCRLDGSSTAFFHDPDVHPNSCRVNRVWLAWPEEALTLGWPGGGAGPHPWGHQRKRRDRDAPWRTAERKRNSHTACPWY